MGVKKIIYFKYMRNGTTLCYNFPQLSMDIATYRLKWPRGRLNEERKKLIFNYRVSAQCVLNMLILEAAHTDPWLSQDAWWSA